MRERRRRNPDFTTDEAQAATLIYTEGSFRCRRERRDATYLRPVVRIRMCVSEALEPASRVLRTKIIPVRTKKIECPPELFPPNGKGYYEVDVVGRHAERVMERLKPLIPEYYNRRWTRLRERCFRPTRPYRLRRRR